MKIITAKQGNKIFYGSIPKIAKFIGLHPETIKRWIKAKKDIVYKNGFEICLNSEKL